MHGIINFTKFTLVVSNYVLNNRGNFHLKFFRRFKDVAVYVVGSLILPHPVYIQGVQKVSYYQIIKNRVKSY